MGEVISLAEKKKEQREKRKKAKKTTAEKIREALKRWGSHSAGKRKNNDDGTPKDK